jgi:predicted phosphate transport protein (TIGR00153 family)
VTAGPSTTFEAQFETINDLEHKGDDLRREIETELYAKTLIPDLRSDVLQLVENIDKVTNLYKSNLFRLSIQRPEIPKTLHSEYERLAEAAVECADALIETTRSFFKDHTVYETVRSKSPHSRRGLMKLALHC